MVQDSLNSLRDSMTLVKDSKADNNMNMNINIKNLSQNLMYYDDQEEEDEKLNNKRSNLNKDEKYSEFFNQQNLIKSRRINNNLESGVQLKSKKSNTKNINKKKSKKNNKIFQVDNNDNNAFGRSNQLKNSPYENWRSKDFSHKQLYYSLSPQNLTEVHKFITKISRRRPLQQDFT